MNTKRHVDQDEKQKPPHRDEVDRTRAVAGSTLLPNQPSRFEIAGTLHEAGEDGSGRRDEYGDEIGKLLEAVVARPAFIDGEGERQVLKRRRDRVRESPPRSSVPALCHWPVENSSDVNDDAVDHPEHGRSKNATSVQDRWNDGCLGMPSQPGCVTESSFAVQIRSAGPLSENETIPCPACSRVSNIAAGGQREFRVRRE